MTEHTVDANWREADAIAFETKVKAIEQWLDHTEDLVAMFVDESDVSSLLEK
jgi:hypothetical protein